MPKYRPEHKAVVCSLVPERVAIVGSRGFKDLDRVRAYVGFLLPQDTVVSGGARGVDSTAEEEARRRGIKVTIFLPDWKAHGKRAGFLRNQDIVNEADRVVAFWDGTSRGTANTIELARRADKPVEVILEKS